MWTVEIEPRDGEAFSKQLFEHVTAGVEEEQEMSEKEIRQFAKDTAGYYAPDGVRQLCKDLLDAEPDVAGLLRILARKRDDSKAEYERLRAGEGPIRSLFLKTSATLRNMQHDFDLGDADDDVDARCDEIKALLENPLGEAEPETYGALMEWSLADKIIEWIQDQFHVRLTETGWEWTEEIGE